MRKLVKTLIRKKMDGKTKAIVAHITWIGWVIALVLNSSEKDEITSFYIRQLLGLYLFSIVITFIPVVNIFGWIITLVFWIISLIGAINEEQKEIPLVGKLFQDWFKAL
jgi:uncharacterized membrane protein